MPMQRQSHSREFTEQILKLEAQENQITELRRQELQDLAGIIRNQTRDQGSSSVIFVCTHNSRRSQLAQLWLKAACTHYRLDGIETFSGGTEATAFNPRMVTALKRFGFSIEKTTDTNNPRYSVNIAEEELVMFSKKYDDPFNPLKDFIAVMVCDQADHDCPFVPGAYARVSLPYEDPKAFDGRDQEAQAYDDKVMEIGREILYLVSVLGSMED
jgi:protein-tyrosine-phosphatase